MLTNEDIENQNYSMNDVADLKMRYDIACDTLEMIVQAFNFDQPHNAILFAQSDLKRIKSDHADYCSGEVRMNDGASVYDCDCMLQSGALSNE